MPVPDNDFTFVKDAMKALCREHGIERDRKTTVEIAALLVALVKEGIHDAEELKVLVRERWMEAAPLFRGADSPAEPPSRS
ncbi:MULTISPECIES: hypothetical protein [Rhizobium]|uniref:hypothetical protein n=1 Tax=Rhizobium TaxID=379 RepID=UPI00041038F6|nr:MULTISPECIES: hypothetical protein [Rhizobium]UFS83634.1 hypothetical protein LPB79_15635 [Rhizobium sp. T136]